ncbi:flagellar protein FlaG [Marinobacterium aestuariivivens]|uniref:Flagellar protein FlaG n=1 Tax=Marinobacterium aestuariivivens TaxID=1698799 RepID=A0ABW1ZX72_9GAMM
MGSLFGLREKHMSIEASNMAPPMAQGTAPQEVSVQSGVAVQPAASAPVAGNGENASAAVSAEKLQAAVDRLNELMQSGQRSLSFSVDSSTERTVVKVMDVHTDEVIRQIPTEESLKLAEYIEGMIGLIFDETV